VQGFDNIYAIGDIAYMETPKYPNGHPQVANVAINQGKNLAKNFLKKLKKIGQNMNIQTEEVWQLLANTELW
jgi:NADH dehydrogenase FAD-containing subunit